MAPVEAAMTPDEFMFEYWKLYDSYMQRKERLVEVTVTLYSGFALAALLRPTITWTRYGPGLVVFGVLVAALVLVFVRAQLAMWALASRLCDASQTAAAECLGRAWAHSSAFPGGILDAVPLPSAPWVSAPAILAAHVPTRPPSSSIARWAREWSLLAWLWPSSFAGVVQFLILLWCAALLSRALLARPADWWGVPAWYQWWCVWAHGVLCRLTAFVADLAGQ